MASKKTSKKPKPAKLGEYERGFVHAQLSTLEDAISQLDDEEILDSDRDVDKLRKELRAMSLSAMRLMELFGYDTEMCSLQNLV
jgi:hypothetical protein